MKYGGAAIFLGAYGPRRSSFGLELTPSLEFSPSEAISTYVTQKKGNSGHMRVDMTV